MDQVSLARAAAERPQNIVLVVADDLGWNDVSMIGRSTATVATRNIDTLAAASVNFRASPINIDRDLSQPDQPGDQFAYWSN